MGNDCSTEKWCKGEKANSVIADPDGNDNINFGLKYPDQFEDAGNQNYEKVVSNKDIRQHENIREPSNEDVTDHNVNNNYVSNDNTPFRDENQFDMKKADSYQFEESDHGVHQQVSQQNFHHEEEQQNHMVPESQFIVASDNDNERVN